MMADLVTGDHGALPAALPPRHGALQRALVSQWQAAGALLASAGLFTLAMAMIPATYQTLFLSLISLLVVPFGIATVTKRMRLYSVAAFWCFASAICALIPLMVLFMMLFTPVTTDLHSLLDVATAALFIVIFAIPIIAADRALLGMGTALLAAPAPRPQLGAG